MKKLWIGLSVLAFLLASCGSEQQRADSSGEEETQTQEKPLLEKAQGYFAVLPEGKTFEGNPKAELGKKLYFENALSVSGEMNCNSCHGLSTYGVDNEATSPGHEGKRGDRNSPTVYNAWFHIAQFWDGRAKDLTEQAKGPILNPIEMGIPDEATAVKNIEAIKEYKALFDAAFPEQEGAITYQNIAEAIAEFEATLRTPAPFDDYLAGDETALSPEQTAGLKVFIEKGCITCHTGAGLGGHMYQKFGLVQGPYWEYTKSEHQDEGRFKVTEEEGDKYMFKVAALRNVVKTAPYFHDGSVSDLKEAIRIMGVTQLGSELSQEEVTSIAAFMESLTGEIPAHALQETGEEMAANN